MNNYLISIVTQPKFHFIGNDLPCFNSSLRIEIAGCRFAERQTCTLQFHSLSKNYPSTPCFWYNKGNGGVFMENWRKDARLEPIIIDLEALVPKDQPVPTNA